VIVQNSTIKSLFLEGPAGRLEALLNAGAENATHAAVVCHPHPLFGGTLHNKVVFHTMKALNGFGFPVLRFMATGKSKMLKPRWTGCMRSFISPCYSQDFLSVLRLDCGQRFRMCR
jgi:hypothetical protein